MADIQANIGIGVDTSQALASIRQLQREISVFHTLMAKGGANAAAKSMAMQQGLINTINETGKFSASMTRISSSTESFTNALEKNKLSMGQYFRYAGGASKSFGKMFSREFNTINRVATERVKDLQTQYISMGRDANGALQSIKVRPLALDMDNLGTKVQLAAQKQQLFNQLMRQGTTNLLNFGKNTQWAGRQLMVGFTIPLTIFGATAVREFQKIEDQVVKFRRVYGDMFNTDAETEKALDNVRQLAEEFTKYGIAVEKTIGLAAKAAQMGNTGSALTEQVTQATRLAVLGGLEQQEALDTTISLTNAFGIAAEDLAGKIAFLNAAENQTILSIEDFNTAIPLSGSVVRQLGGDVEDLAVLLTAMREGGINASQAGNALKSSLGRLIAPSRNAKETLGSFGIDVLGIVNNNAGDLMGTINTLAYSLDELDPLSRARSIEALFGKFQFARMSTLFSNIVRDGSQASKVLGLTANSTAELAIIAERELKRVEESPAFKLQKQMEQLKSALAPIGAEFVKAILPIVEFGTKILKAFNNMGEGGKQFVVVLTAIAGVVAPAALMAFGLVANGIANLIKFFQFLGTAFGMLSGKSTLLGGQTEYMTQQQLEAAAVAASLGQSHSNLTQIFTAEAGAISNLVAQYRAAITAQRQLSIGQTAAGVAARGGARPRGFAKGGIIRGPGTGTSDSIPAMVSNGEAIIPAKQTQKYYGLIEAIIGNNVPGYATAKLPEPSANAMQIAKDLSSNTKTADSVAKHVEKEIQKRANHFDLTLEQAASDIANAVAPLKGAVNKVNEFTDSPQFSGIRAQRVSEVEQQNQFAHFGGGTSVSTGRAAEMAPGRAILQTMAKVDPEGTLAAKHSWGMDLSRQANREMDVSPDQIAAAADRKETPGRGRDLLVKEMSDRSEGEAFDSLREGLERGGADTNDAEVQATAVEYHQKIVSLLSEKLKDNADAMVVDTDEQFAMMTPEQQANAISMESVEREAAQGYEGTKFGAARQAALDRPKELRLRVNEDVMGKAQGALDRGDITQEEYDSLAGIKARGGSKDVQLSKTAELPGMEQLEKEAAEIGANIVRSNLDAQESEAGIGSPAKRFIEIGRNIVNSTAMGMEEEAAEQTGKPPLPGNLAAPKPPVQPEAAQPGRFGKFFSSAKDKINESKIAQRAADYLSGEDLTDKINVTRAMADGEMENLRTAKAINQDLYDKGLITEDMQQTALGQAQGVTPVRVVEGQIDIGDNSIDTLANASPAANDAAEQDKLKKATEDQRAAAEAAAEATEDAANISTDKNKDDKAALKESRRQNRQSVAGKALAGLGGLTMVAGMATQVEGVVGETAQQLVGPLAAISGIAPVLIAMGPIWGTLLAAIGGGIYLWYQHNKALEEARKKAHELAEALGTGREQIQKFADFAGTATSSEIMDRRRQSGRDVFQIEPGKTTFGMSFMADDVGKEFANSVREGIQAFGQDETIKRVANQLSVSVLSGALSVDQARSIMASLGEELNNYDLSVSVQSTLVSLFGPDGENLLDGGTLKVATEIAANVRDVAAKTVADAAAGPTPQSIEARAKENNRASGEKRNWWEFPMFVSDESLTATGAREAARPPSQRELDEAKAQLELETGQYAASALAGVVASNNQVIDSLIVSYDEQIAAAEKAGDFVKAQSLRDEINAAREEFVLANQDAVQEMVNQYLSSTDAPQFREDQKARILEATPEDQRENLGTSLDTLANAAGVTYESKMILSTNLEAGTISPDQFNLIIKTFEGQELDQAAELVMKYGADSADVIDIISGLEEGMQGELVTKFLAEDTTLGEGLSLFETLNNIRKTGLAVEGNSDILIDFYVNDATAGEELQEKIQALRDQLSTDGPITLDVVERIFAEDPEVVQLVKDNQEAFDAMPEEDKVEFLQTAKIQYDVYASGDEDLIKIFKNSQGVDLNLDVKLTPKQVGDEIFTRSDRFARSSRTDTTGDDEETDPTPTGSGSEPQIDSLIKKLRDLRLATIDMKKGWGGMQEALESVFAGGTKGIDVFNGLSNQIRKMGVGENLIEMIVGMDPDEYAKRKNELFVFDKAGNITGTTAKLKNLSSAFNAIAIGEYVNSQQAFIENTKNQFNAMNTLVASGMSLADAYELVQDEALAAAIAMGATRAEIDEIIRITSLMKEQQRRSEREQERINTSKAVKETNKDFENQVRVLNKLAKAQGQYSDAQINAIMSDKSLQAIFLDPSIDPKALENALKNAEQQANLEVQIALKTAAGQEAKFNEYAAEVSDYFAREEALINLNFEVATADDSKIVEDAQNQIADIQYKLDDYNAELEQISWIEDDINEKYDKRSEALENIAETNDRIAQQQKAQLNIADALSQGDIAAAARAAQELRDQQATNAQEDQKSMLDRARQAELGAVRGPGGMTREELEDQITALERQMFLIEEQSLEPAQERIRLAEVTKNLAIERLELEGKSRMEWEQISAATGQAAMDMEAMVLAARKASALSEFIRTGEKGADWDELFPQPKAAAAPAPSSGGGGGGGGSSPAPAPASAPASSGPTIKEKSAEWSKNITDTIRNLPSENSAEPVRLTPVSTPGALTAKKGTPKPVKKLTASSPEVKQAIAISEKFAKMGRAKSSGGLMKYAMGGKVGRYANGGMIIPKRMAMGGYSMGSDTIPAILTPGEFVVRRPAVSAFGVDKLESINRGTYNDGSVYNYNLAVNVNSNADPSRIARAVITQIKRVDSQRIRNNKL